MIDRVPRARLSRAATFFGDNTGPNRRPGVDIFLSSRLIGESFRPIAASPSDIELKNRAGNRARNQLDVSITFK